MNGLKGYTVKQLEALARQLRGELVAAVETCGGHLSSNLGAVEIVLALHKVFSFPQDKLLFDVGHQAYVHKLLTGRSLERLRQKGGVSGFPDPSESECDAFVAGHSGNSLAAGIGLCNARDLTGGSEKVICLIGDASLGNGLALEAVFSAEKKPENFLVVLNDNGMAIDKNRTAYRAISRMTAKKRYRTFNSRLAKTFKETGAFGRVLRRFKYSLKGWLNKNDFFDRCGFKYVGPVNGHDLHELVAVLSDIQKLHEPVLLHCVTQKGKGYPPAEADPARYHSTGKGFAAGKNTFSSALGRLLCAEAERDASLVCVTAAMAEGVGLSAFAERFPQRFFDVGICEEYAVTMAAGMAKGGMHPVVCLYATFLQRAYDQILHDVCLQDLPVLFCEDRAGFVGADGKTHQGLYDLAALRAVPNLRIFAPKDAAELSDVFAYARSCGGPALLRYPGGEVPMVGKLTSLAKSLWEVLAEGQGAVVLACGARAVRRALEARKAAGCEDTLVVNCRSIVPLDEPMLAALAGRQLVCFEENALAGGFGAAVAEWYAARGIPVRLRIMGAPPAFAAHGTAEEQAEEAGLTAKALAAQIRALRGNTEETNG